jgi:hypothetical protein
VFAAFASIVKELTSDVVAVALLGPSFFLSLSEMSWGFDPSKWQISLAPELHSIRAYPSFGFRLACVAQQAGLDEFCKGTAGEFQRLGVASVKNPSSLFRFPPTDPAEEVVVRPESDGAARVLQESLNEHLAETRQTLEGFVRNSATYVNQLLSGADVGFSPDAARLAKLILRLEKHVPPNIVPDSSFLGEPAAFADIVLAASLCRMSILSAWPSDPGSQRDRTQNLKRIERLTAKAFEVSYIQREYNRWRKRGEAGDGGAAPAGDQGSYQQA